MPKKFNPGEALFHWIYDRYKRMRVNSDSWIPAMAREFDMDDLEEYLMRSTALMLLRRLIWNADWYNRRYSGNERYTIQNIYERDYLNGVFGFNRSDRRVVGKLVFQAYEASKQEISLGLFNRMKRNAKKREQKCEISGCEINYCNSNQYNSFSLDHIWPQSFGGLSKEDNLRVACKRCNDKRKNIVEPSDIHYEHFHIKSNRLSDEENKFKQELSWEYRIAVLLRDNFRCCVCETQVTDMEGGFDFSRYNHDENYNMFNIQVTCGKHRTK